MAASSPAIKRWPTSTTILKSPTSLNPNKDVRIAIHDRPSWLRPVLTIDSVPSREIAFPWCGFLIDTLDLSVRADYMRYNDTCEFAFSPFITNWREPDNVALEDTVDSLTVDRGRKAGATFLHKMLQYVPSLYRPSSHSLLLTSAHAHHYPSFHRTLFILQTS